MSIHKKFFMIKKLYKDIARGENFYSICDDIHGSILGQYYFVFDEKRVRSGKDQSLISSFDKDGIPLNNTYIDVSEVDLIYYPISIGQMGLSVYHTYLRTKSIYDLNRFLKFADWYKENAIFNKNSGAKWLTNVALPAYENPGPWQSAFAQSRAISILLRAFQETGQNEYNDLAKRAIIPFSISVRDGGVTSFTEWGPFFEEYTASVPILVFNGHIFSLFGLYDYIRVNPENTDVLTIFRSGIKTLVKCLPTFDLGYWTRYNYCQAPFYPDVDPSTLSYQRLHIMLLKIINRISPQEEFSYFIKKWNEQIRIINYLKSGLVKST